MVGNPPYAGTGSATAGTFHEIQFLKGLVSLVCMVPNTFKKKKDKVSD
jgi:hypothetical protein